MEESQNPKIRVASVLPLEQVATRTWLEANGLGRHSLDNALKSGQLVALTAGVYARPELPVNWQGVVASLPRLESQPILIGGLSALRLQGFAQYLNLGASESVVLTSNGACPAWLERCFAALQTRLVWQSGRRLWKHGWPSMPAVRKVPWQDRGMVLPTSAPEQAFLELLGSAPDGVSLEHAEELLQGLTQLSPNLLDALLRECRSIKVKRLFFWLADRQNHTWRQRLDSKSYDLGSGNRVLVKGGRLDQVYHITVPQEMVARDPRGFSRAATAVRCVC